MEETKPKIYYRAHMGDNAQIWLQSWELIKKSRSRYLLLEPNGESRWYGPWAAQCPLAETPEEAVQLLAWSCDPRSIHKDMAVHDNTILFGAWQLFFDTKYQICLEWLQEHGIEPKEPWYLKPTSNAYSRRRGVLSLESW